MQIIVTIFLIVCIVSAKSTYTQYHQYPVRGGFTIGDNQYVLQWQVYHNFISFEAVGKGNGYVGFGISPTGKGMTDSDLFISGIFENGTVYAVDGHGGAEMDERNDYRLLFAAEDPMFTVIQFQRLLNTGDTKDDIAIMNEPQYIMWSVGPKDDIKETHGTENRGFVLVNLLNPPIFHSYYKGTKQMGMEGDKDSAKTMEEAKPEM